MISIDVVCAELTYQFRPAVVDLEWPWSPAGGAVVSIAGGRSFSLGWAPAISSMRQRRASGRMMMMFAQSGLVNRPDRPFRRPLLERPVPESRWGWWVAAIWTVNDRCPRGLASPRSDDFEPSSRWWLIEFSFGRGTRPSRTTPQLYSLDRLVCRRRRSRHSAHGPCPSSSVAVAVATFASTRTMRPLMLNWIA